MKATEQAGGGSGFIFSGYRVLEVAQNIFAPAAAMVLSDFGADVIKVEHHVRGDPHRGLVTGRVPPIANGVNLAMAQANRGKRSLGLNLASTEGQKLLYELVRTSDVFLTNFLPRTLTKLGIEEETIRIHNPTIVYARATGQGPSGPDSEKGGYDASVYWARGSVASTIGAGISDRPPTSPPAFGDRAGAMNLAFGISAGLLHRERTGQGCVVDVSLLGTALWQNSSTIVYSLGNGRDVSLAANSTAPGNPLVYTYRTLDGGWISLVMMQSDRYWPDFCRKVGRPDLINDERFASHEQREENSEECMKTLQDIFEKDTLENWRERLKHLKGPWAPFQSPLDVVHDGQVEANGYIEDVAQANGVSVRLVRPPVTFGGIGTSPPLRRAPEHAEHSESILLELGYSWEEISRLKDSEVVA